MKFVGSLIEGDYFNSSASSVVDLIPKKMPDECGKTNVPGGRIQNGVAKKGELPWMVYLKDGCTAVLVSRYYVLTSGKCFLNSHGENKNPALPEIPDKTMYHGECGISHYTPKETTWEDDVENGEFPWLANLQSTCTGVLISRKCILAAAHCIKENAERRIYLGEMDFMKFEHKYTSDRFRKHQTLDIAVIMLDSLVPSTDYTIPICMPIDFHYRGLNNTGIVAGWGSTQAAVFSSVTTQEALQARH